MKFIAKSSFELRNTKKNECYFKENGGLSRHKIKLQEKKIPFYTFHPKLVKLIKEVIQYLPGDIPAEDCK